MLCVASATLTKLREPAAILAPTQRILGPWMKNTHTVVQFQLAFLAKLLGATYLLPGEACPYQHS